MIESRPKPPAASSALRYDGGATPQVVRGSHSIPNARASPRRAGERAHVRVHPSAFKALGGRAARMDTALISASSALAGSVIGGFTTGFTTLVSLRSQARAGQVAHDLARREDLIRDFIIAASKLYGDAIVNSEPKMPEIVDLYAMVS